MPVDRPGSSSPLSHYRPPTVDSGSATPSRPEQERLRPAATGGLAQLRPLGRQAASNARQFAERGFGVPTESSERSRPESSSARSDRPAPSTPSRPGATPPRWPFGGRRVEQAGASTSAAPARSPLPPGARPNPPAQAPGRELDRLRRMTEVAFPYESLTLALGRDLGAPLQQRQLDSLRTQAQRLREDLNTPHGRGIRVDQGSDGRQLRLDANFIELRALLPMSSRSLTATDELRSAAANTVKHAKRHFRAFAANPPPRPAPMAQPSTHHSAEIMKAMLNEAPGIVIGEAHSAVSSKRTLIKHMGELKKAGVKTLFMEHLCSDVHGPALAQYLAAPRGAPMPDRLASYLSMLDDGHMSGATGHRTSEAHKYNFTSLIQAAKQAGLNIVPIDTAATYALSDTGNSAHFEGDRERARTEAMNFVAAEKIRLLAGDGKWVAFVGNTHATTYQGTPGLAQLTGTRAMFIDDEGDSTKARVAVNVRDYLNLGVLSPDIVLSYKK